MKKITLVLTFLTVTFINPCGIAQEARQVFLMNQHWKFAAGDVEDAQQPEFDDRHWHTLDLPHDWSIEQQFSEDAPAGGRGAFLPAGILWYRKTFSLENTQGKSIWIDFDGVYMNCDVWINGHHLGNHPYGYTGFHYSLSPYLQKGANTLAVRVDNSQQPNSRWYTGTGIYRNVWITVAHPLHVGHRGVYITTPVVDSTEALVHIATTLSNDGNSFKNVILQSKVIDGQGNEAGMAETTAGVRPGETITVEQDIVLKTPLLWSVDHPAMYSLRTAIKEGKKTIDQVTTSFGVRSIEYSADEGFLLNGRKVKMKGVCLHHNGGCVGAAVPVRVWERRLEILKGMGCNAIRTAHNPPAPEFLDLCDRMGFLVMDEAFDEWKAGKVKYGYHLYFDQWYEADLVSFIHRDRNHPSVVMWSAGNEIGEQSLEGGHRVLNKLITIFHREDPTRPVTTGNDHIAADGRKAFPEFLDMLDIVGYNYVDRWRERRELYYSVDRLEHPGRKMVGTESVSVGGIRGQYSPGKEGSPFRPAYNASMIRAEQLWKFVALHNYVIGDFMWTGIDYLGEAWWPAKNASSGVIDMCGFPKDGYYFYQSQWTDTPMVHLFPHWNWAGHEGQVIPVIAYTNCDSVELFVNGKSYGAKSYEFPRQGNEGSWNRYARPFRQTTTADLHLSWDVPYEPGTIRAVGKKDGKIAVTEVIHTAGKPSSLRITCDRNPIYADGRDVTHLRIEVLDENGYLVPDAANRITLTVRGEGRLIGFDNGNPFDHDPFRSHTRNAFNGLALAVIQSDRKAGKITVETSSDGLAPARTEISTLPGKSIPEIR